MGSFAGCFTGFFPVFSSISNVKILLSCCGLADKIVRSSFFSIGRVFGLKQAILAHFGRQSVNLTNRFRRFYC